LVWLPHLALNMCVTHFCIFIINDFVCQRRILLFQLGPFRYVSLLLVLFLLLLLYLWVLRESLGKCMWFFPASVCPCVTHLFPFIIMSAASIPPTKEFISAIKTQVPNGSVPPTLLSWDLFCLESWILPFQLIKILMKEWGKGQDFKA